MTDIIDFEDKRNERFGEQNETEVEGFDGQRGASPDSDEDSQENNNVKLAANHELKTPAYKNNIHNGQKVLQWNECASGCLKTVITI